MDFGRYTVHSPSPSTASQSPHISSVSSATSVLIEQEKYLSELLAERQKLSPFVPVLPHSYRLVNQEILRVTLLLETASILDQTGHEHGSRMASGGLFLNGGTTDMDGWASAFQSERLGLMHPPSATSWLGSQGSPSGFIVKKTVRIDIPVDKYPTYNFVGRLLGPRGNSLKRVEANTDCHILIRGRGSIKDPVKEEMMRGKPGYEHLDEPLHILIEAELPIEIIDTRLMQAREVLEDLLKPVEESQDLFKKNQLLELAMINGMINGTLREESAHMSGSASPFHSAFCMKIAKTIEE